MGNSRRLLFLGAVGCSCCNGRLVTFWDVVFYGNEKETPVTKGNLGEGPQTGSLLDTDV